MTTIKKAPATKSAKNTSPKGKAGNPGASQKPKAAPPAKSAKAAPKGQRACTAELALDILKEIEENDVSFSEACRRCLTNKSDAWRFIHADPKLDQRYARARESRGNHFGEQVAQIGLATLAGRYKPDAARVAADCLKWASGRMASKYFGDRVVNEHVGPGGGAIPLAVFTPAQMSNLTDAEIEAMIAIAAKLGLPLPGVAAPLDAGGPEP